MTVRKIIGTALVWSPALGVLITLGIASTWWAPLVLIVGVAALMGIIVLGLWIAGELG